jgi:hypothetical protein
MPLRVAGGGVGQAGKKKKKGNVRFAEVREELFDIGEESDDEDEVAVRASDNERGETIAQPKQAALSDNA